MKKVMIVLGFIILFIGLIACSKDIEDVQIDTQGDYFLYPMNETIYGFDVDKNGVLIYSTVEDQGEVSIKSIHGEEMKKKRYVGFLYSVDFDGNKLDTYELGEDIHANRLVIDGDKVVFSAYALTEGENGFEEGVRFYELTLNNKMTKVIYNFLDIDGLIKFEFIDDFIYFLGTDNKNIHKEFTLASNEDDYVYNGEVLGYIDTIHETWVEIPVEFPISFSKTADSNLLIYAHDNKGYYFIEYNTQRRQLSDNKIYNNLGIMDVFEVCNENNDIIFNSYQTSIRSLVYSPMKEENTTAELMPNTLSDEIVCQGDYTYYNNALNLNRIERLKNSTYIRGNKTINMISIEDEGYSPFNCGYIMKREYPTAEEFALSVLSQDNSFDLYLMSSRQNVSENIRSKGAFYPLNEVDGVKEYLQSCFPYIREVATTEDGDIWMLPISVAVPCIIYNEELCLQYGIDLSSTEDLNSLITVISSLKSKADIPERYTLSTYLIRENLLYQYLHNSKRFDDEQFIELASLIKKDLNFIQGDYLNNPSAEDPFYNGNINNFLLETTYYQEEQYRYAKSFNIKVKELPTITENKKNVATCLYLCVNPASKNLKATLKYISSLCNYLTARNDILLFADRDRYPDSQAMDELYCIYSSSEIVFTLPYEILYEDFDKYLMDQMDLNTMIKEVSRKTDTFLKE